MYTSAKYEFPSVESALDTGLLAVGGDLNSERLLTAYRLGIFPWYSAGEPIQWYAPNPRFVLFPHELRISKSMKQLLKRQPWVLTENRNFVGVIRSCAEMKRKDQDGTWITPEMIDAYIQLHKMGIAVSVEVWEEEQLIGGLYGLKMNGLFFGESMFTQKPNASKYAFISFVQKHQGELKLVDCQAHTIHLESLGARMISRKEFSAILQGAFK